MCAMSVVGGLVVVMLWLIRRFLKTKDSEVNKDMQIQDEDEE